MSQIITPRWEWRSFGGAFDALEALVPGANHTSHEIYVLSDCSATNVKIRNSVIEVKVLQRMRHGLELWMPEFKAAFPLDQTAVRRVFELWPLAPPALMASEYSEIAFVTEIAGQVRGLHAIGVAKSRRQTVFDGCQVEVGAIAVGGRVVPMAAVEMEDADRVLRVVRDLRLDHYDNVNYVNFLKHVLNLKVPPLSFAPPEGASHEEDSLSLVRPAGDVPGDPCEGPNPGSTRR